MEPNSQLGMQQSNISALAELENSLNVYENPYLTKFQMERILSWRKDLPAEGQWESMDHFDAGSRDETCSCLLHKNKSSCSCPPNKIQSLEVKKKPSPTGKRNIKRRYCSLESQEEAKQAKQTNCFELLNLENKSETLNNQKKKCKFGSADERKLSDVIKKMKSTVLSSEKKGEERDDFAHISNHMTNLEFYEETLIKKKKSDGPLQKHKIKTQENKNKCLKVKGCIERKIKINHQNPTIEEIWMKEEISEEISEVYRRINNKKNKKPIETSQKTEIYKKNPAKSLIRSKKSCKTLSLNKVSFFIQSDKNPPQLCRNETKGNLGGAEYCEIKLKPIDSVPKNQQSLLRNIKSLKKQRKPDSNPENKKRLQKNTSSKFRNAEELKILEKYFHLWFNILLSIRVKFAKAEALHSQHLKIAAWKKWQSYFIHENIHKQLDENETRIMKNKIEKILSQVNKKLQRKYFHNWRRWTIDQTECKKCLQELNEMEKKLLVKPFDKEEIYAIRESTKSIVEEKMKELQMTLLKGVLQTSKPEVLLPMKYCTDKFSIIVSINSQNFHKNLKISQTDKTFKSSDIKNHYKSKKLSPRQKSHDFEKATASKNENIPTTLELKDNSTTVMKASSLSCGTVKSSELQQQRKYVKKIKSPTILKATNAKAEERRRKWNEIQNKKLKEKQEIKMRVEAELRAQEEQQQMRKKKEQRLRKEKLQADLIRKQELQHNRELFRKKIQVANKFYEQYLLNSVGFQSWKKFLQVKKQEYQRATHFYHLSLKRLGLNTWKTFYQRKCYKREKIASEFMTWRLKKVYFHNWLKIALEANLSLQKLQQFYILCVKLNEDAKKYQETHILSKVLISWKLLTSTQLLEQQKNEVMVERYYSRYLLKKAFIKWMNFHEIQQKQILRENRLNKLREKVKQIIPDFTY